VFAAGVSLATGAEEDDRGLSETTPRFALLSGSVVRLDGGAKGGSSVNVDTAGT
jgi:hypothetical protein